MSVDRPSASQALSEDRAGIQILFVSGPYEVAEAWLAFCGLSGESDFILQKEWRDS